MDKKRKILLFVDVLVVLLLVGLDQATKYLAVIKLKGRDAFPVIPQVLEFKYLENRGAAFGMLQNQKVFFICMEVLILLIVCYILAKCPAQKKYRLGRICMIGIAAGDVGNMIDRVVQDFVVDFIYFVPINFPIFNVADIYVTLSTIGLVILLLFVYKEQDLSFLSFQQKKLRDVDGSNGKS